MRIFKAAAVLLGITVALALSEVAARVYLRQRTDLEKIRALLAGEIVLDENARDTHGELSARYIGQCYLNYVAAPNYRLGANYHNEQGYRGKSVPIKRTPGVVRIICLGGSTTYGVGVDSADAAYPTQLEKILQEDLPDGIAGVEVINGGLTYGTTAECFTHYHFKYHYFRPDIVIINTGGNDADVMAYPYYQPDYSHWRKPLQIAQPLGPTGRAAMKSRLAALILMPLIYGREPAASWIRRPFGARPPTVWYPCAQEPDASESVKMAAAIDDDELAFTHNVQALIDEVIKDGATPLLVPYRIGPGLDYLDGAPEVAARHERILRKIAETRNLDLAPYPGSVISPQNWTDSSHLNEAGQREKAAHIAEYVRRILARPPKP